MIKQSFYHVLKSNDNDVEIEIVESPPAIRTLRYLNTNTNQLQPLSLVFPFLLFGKMVGRTGKGLDQALLFLGFRNSPVTHDDFNVHFPTLPNVYQYNGISGLVCLGAGVVNKPNTSITELIDQFWYRPFDPFDFQRGWKGIPLLEKSSLECIDIWKTLTKNNPVSITDTVWSKDFSFDMVKMLQVAAAKGQVAFY